MNRIYIDCPYCYSTNKFSEPSMSSYKCIDCGANLKTNNLETSGNDINVCIFCGGGNFYYEYPFSIAIFKRRNVCYICEATYIGFNFECIVDKYNKNTFKKIKEIKQYKDWLSFWKNYKNK